MSFSWLLSPLLYGVAYAQSSNSQNCPNSFQAGLKLLPSDSSNTYCSFNDYFSHLVGLAVEVALGFAVLVILYAAYLYINSQGEAAKISQAKELVAGSLTGLILLFLARLILSTLNIK